MTDTRGATQQRCSCGYPKLPCARSQSDCVAIQPRREPTSAGDLSPETNGREWGEGPEGDNDVREYIEATPALFAMILELHLAGALEAQETDTPDWETIFTIANHWRENEISLGRDSDNGTGTRSEKAVTPFTESAPNAARAVLALSKRLRAIVAQIGHPDYSLAELTRDVTDVADLMGACPQPNAAPQVDAIPRLEVGAPTLDEIERQSSGPLPAGAASTPSAAAGIAERIPVLRAEQFSPQASVVRYDYVRDLWRSLEDLKALYGSACLRLQALGEKDVSLVSSEARTGLPKKLSEEQRELFSSAIMHYLHKRLELTYGEAADFLWAKIRPSLESATALPSEERLRTVLRTLHQAIKAVAPEFDKPIDSANMMTWLALNQAQQLAAEALGLSSAADSRGEERG